MTDPIYFQVLRRIYTSGLVLAPGDLVHAVEPPKTEADSTPDVDAPWDDVEGSPLLLLTVLKSPSKGHTDRLVQRRAVTSRLLLKARVDMGELRQLTPMEVLVLLPSAPQAEQVPEVNPYATKKTKKRK